jgi:hypothetical protein
VNGKVATNDGALERSRPIPHNVVILLRWEAPAGSAAHE